MITPNVTVNVNVNVWLLGLKSDVYVYDNVWLQAQKSLFIRVIIGI